MIGQLLGGRYRIVQTLGIGGMAQTYVAQDTHHPGNLQCVVKRLQPSTNNPKVISTARNMFHREARILGELGNHPYIPRLLGYFEEDQQFYLVQEFIDGYPLSAEMQPGQRWTESEVIRLLFEILEILQFVHSQGVIHRDIKPDNLIRRQDGKLVLIDFGAVQEVKAQLATAIPTQANVGIGTFGYMPTEQAQGKPRPNSDIYALGMVGIQALTGLMPTQLPEDEDSGELHWEHFVPVSQGLATILNQMVRYHFRERYQNATEALQALQPLANVLGFGLPGFTSPDGESLKVTLPPPIEGQSPNKVTTVQDSKSRVGEQKKSRRKNWLLVGLGTLGAIAALGIGARNWFPTTAQSPTPQVQSPVFGDGVLDLGVVTTKYNPKQVYFALAEHLETELSEKLNQEVTVRLHTIDWQETESLEKAKRELKQQSWDVVFANGALVSASAAIDHNYQFVAQMFPKFPQFESALFVKTDSSISSLADVNVNTKVALGEVNSAAGFTMPVYDLYGKKLQLDINNSLENILKKVTSGESAVGAAPYPMVAGNPDLEKKFKVIHRSRGIPLPGVFLAPELREDERDLVKNSLLNAPEDLQAKAQYSASEVVNYEYFNGINNKVEAFLGCGDLSQSPVQLWCPDAIIGQVKEYSSYSPEITHLKLQSKDGQFYRLILPQQVFKQDPSLPSSLPGFYGKEVVVSEEVEKQTEGDLTKLIITQPGQLIIRE